EILKCCNVRRKKMTFYDFVIVGDKELRAIAHELTKTVKENMGVDWSKRDSAKAKMRVAVRRLLKKYGYPPDLQKMAVEKVVEQAKLMASNQ
ncbi:type I restriction enzyme endonuclease domain-containing protein, partial [Staphylococcus hominis]|uniref:type I restriction enzyme endonuclease domain-containing protein n=1 Tax=Staphylococcus hominis TaxID=1290 RepID=UPI003CFF3E71